MAGHFYFGPHLGRLDLFSDRADDDFNQTGCQQRHNPARCPAWLTHASRTHFCPLPSADAYDVGGGCVGRLSHKSRPDSSGIFSLALPQIGGAKSFKKVFNTKGSANDSAGISAEARQNHIQVGHQQPSRVDHSRRQPDAAAYQICR